jgi:hypothetical protein
MSRLRNIPGRATIALGCMLLGALAVACEEDGKTAPEKCGSPPLLIYDVQGGAQGDPDANPCVTDEGHAVSVILPASSGGSAPTNTGGSGGKGGAGGSGGSSGKGGTGGKGGAGGKGGTAGTGGK